MPVAAAVAVADAIVELLQPLAVAEEVTATCERAYVPVRDLLDSETLLVSVVPGVGQSPPETRTSWRRDYRIGIAVQQRLPLELQTAEDKRTWLDGKLLFVEMLQAELEDSRLTVQGDGAEFPLDAVITLVEIDTLYLPDELEEDRVFAAELFATCRTRRDLA